MTNDQFKAAFVFASLLVAFYGGLAVGFGHYFTGFTALGTGLLLLALSDELLAPPMS